MKVNGKSISEAMEEFKVNEKKMKYGGKLNKEDAEILKDTLTKKYRKDKRIEVHFKLVKIGKGYGMEFNVMPIRHGDDDDTVLNRVEAELTNEIKGIINKWEVDNPMNEAKSVPTIKVAIYLDGSRETDEVDFKNRKQLDAWLDKNFKTK